MPPLRRTAIEPEAWGPLNPLGRLLRRRREPLRPGPMAGRLNTQGALRRALLLLLSLAPALYATYIMAGLLPRGGVTALEVGVLALFAVLSSWVAAGFWTAIMGFFTLVQRGDRYLISRSTAGVDEAIPPEARTAIVMPICNEDVRRVFAGLRATWESLADTGQAERFDLFVLSDSNDPDLCVAEAAAWRALRDELGLEGRIFYRRRHRRVKRKSGNIDDFCRRWGAAYRYMVVLDADSIMSGSCLTTLVRIMEARPDAGIVQTAPRAVLRDTLHARVQQFATHVYGPIFTAGLHFWQLGESHYWGHNAIIRLAPFMAHCALAPLPGRGSLSGEILSHDFVEAALMRRAGWGVWIAYDLDGSYEETPPNLLDEVKRDRRWCHGNLMNFRLFTARGIRPVHRAVFLTGLLAYVSAPLWLAFLVLSTSLLVGTANLEPQYFPVPYQLFPLWPSWRPEHALALFAGVAGLLFVPKILGAFVVGWHDAKRYGGGWRLAASTLVEMILSALLAPVRMLFHTQFVLAALFGWKIQWKSPAREDAATSLGEAVRRHGVQTLIGLGWLAIVLYTVPHFVGWVAPVALGLALSIPISVVTSSRDIGVNARQGGLFLTPGETDMPVEVRATRRYARAAMHLPDFVDAVLAPKVNALVAGVGHPRRSDAARARLDQWVERAAVEGPEALDNAARLALLRDGRALVSLHARLIADPALAAVWHAREQPREVRERLPLAVSDPQAAATANH
jgi:membrane glycosyltransferase